MAARGAAGGFAVPGVDPQAPVGGRKLPVLRVLGQVSQSYIITEGPDGVYMVDQHAAHERILLERMVSEWRARAVTSQMLLEPLPVELSAGERETVEEHLEALRRIGFEIEPFGAEAMLVRAVPAVLSEQARSSSLRELVLQLAGADARGGAPRRDVGGARAGECGVQGGDQGGADALARRAARADPPVGGRGGASELLPRSPDDGASEPLGVGARV